MEITEVKLSIRNEPKLKGFANITFDRSFVVRGLKIIDSGRGLFISMPSKKRPGGGFQDIAHPINADMRRIIEQTVLDAYHRELEKLQNQKIPQ